MSEKMSQLKMEKIKKSLESESFQNSEGALIFSGLVFYFLLSVGRGLFLGGGSHILRGTYF